MRAARTYHRRDNWPGVLPGLDDGTEKIDVTSFASFTSPVRFSVEGQPLADDFLLQRHTWQDLGQPDRIRVTVEAA